MTCQPGSNGCTVVTIHDHNDNTQCLMVDGRNLISDSCPTTSKRMRIARSPDSHEGLDWIHLGRRALVRMPYWTLFKSTNSNTTKLINANMNQTSGCLHVPASGQVIVGSCSDPPSDGWILVPVTSKPDDLTTKPPNTVPVGAIAGGVAGGVVAIAAVIGGIIYFRKRGKNTSFELQNGPQNGSAGAPSNTPSEQPNLAGKAMPMPAPFKSASPALSDPYNPPVPQYVEMQPVPNDPPPPTNGTGHRVFDYYNTKNGSDQDALFVDVQVFAKALQGFVPTENDEMKLDAGDEIFVDRVFADGWAGGTNMSTGQAGLFPADMLDLALDKNGGQQLRIPDNQPRRMGSVTPAAREAYVVVGNGPRTEELRSSFYSATQPMPEVRETPVSAYRAAGEDQRRSINSEQEAPEVIELRSPSLSFNQATVAAPTGAQNQVGR